MGFAISPALKTKELFYFQSAYSSTIAASAGVDAKAVDSNQIPAPHVTYRYGNNTLTILSHATARVRELLDASGAIEILDNGNVTPFAHLMGTARMGSDPKMSVVNAWNQAHDVKNLFIVDGSSFATCAGVNPTSTIGALALRCADGIWEHRSEWV